ncbi:MAG: single-stranded-DNA-specific exonuclease RecJ [Deltaproteobacteria bacterium]|nr:single-stranded-DNA-specific exonuclease RecJ [Deltaproteobacteria bacterium]
MTIWKLSPPSPQTARLATESNITPLQAQLLINRGITDSSSAASFLAPKLSQLLDPMLLQDMDTAVERIVEVIERQEKITVYGDYDADGITATALLLNFFSSLGISASFYVPNRFTEGYGLNAGAVGKIVEDGTALIITVDCGTSNQKEIDLAGQCGVSVVVTDHHQIPEDFGPKCPVLNPHRSDSSFCFKSLAGVGVAFFLVIAVRAALRDKGWFENREEPDLKDYLDLVALGTVADMVPLLNQNRILVKWGIERMKSPSWPGIEAMKEIAALNTSRITPYDLAYKLAPRLNAPGRLRSAEIGVQLLTTEDQSLARHLAHQLNSLNSERQGIEQAILEQIEEKIISMQDLEERRTLVLSGNNWHRGVLGIAASRLVSKYHRPTLLLDVRNGVAVGSGRSIDGFNLHQALERLSHLFEKFGGHYHAAGFTLKASHIQALNDELEDLAQEVLSKDDLIPRIEVDGSIPISALNEDIIRDIQLLAPFGSGNPEPLFHSQKLDVIHSRVVGERHLKLQVGQGECLMEAIGFGFSDWHPLQGETIDMVFTPEINDWRGYEKVQLKIVDLQITGGKSRLITS